MSLDIPALKARHHIEQIIAEHVVLIPDGVGRLKGLCPFHNERSASFTVYPDTQSYYCFGAGCQAHGDILDFLQRLHGWSFLTAVEYLLARNPDAFVPRQPRQPATAVDAQLAALQVAMSCYRRDIDSRWSPQARSWLASRGLMPEGRRHIIDVCQLGYCRGDRATAIIAELRDREIPLAAALDSGVIKLNRETGEYYEPFAHRLIIPEIRRGVVVWMTGRWIGRDGQGMPGHGPKYLNIRGTKRLLGAERVMGHKEVIVVESPMDQLTLVGWGYPAAGMQGGSIPREDLAMLAGTEKVYLPHNRDEAGWNATCRLAEHLGERAYSIFLPPDIYGQPVKDINDLAWRGHNPYLGLQLFRASGLQAVRYDDQLWRDAYSQ